MPNASLENYLMLTKVNLFLCPYKITTRLAIPPPLPINVDHFNYHQNYLENIKTGMFRSTCNKTKKSVLNGRGNVIQTGLQIEIRLRFQNSQLEI